MRDAAGHGYAFPDGTVLDPGATLTLHTGSEEDATVESGTDTDHYYRDASGPVWNNAGDTVFVRTAEWRLVLEVAYDTRHGGQDDR